MIVNIDALDKPLLKSLIDGTISFADVMNAYNVKTTLTHQLPNNILGFVYVSRRGNYHLILNANVNFETQCKTFFHEINHIVQDLPKAGYIIGLDMHHSSLELEADYVAEVIGEYVASI